MTPSEKRERRRKAILEAFRKTGSIKATVRLLRVSRRSVRRALRGREIPACGAPSKQPPRPSKLDPYRAVIGRLVLEDQLTATLILDELRPLGFTGSYSILKRYVRTIRPAPKTKVTTRIEHEPGSPGQIDWSPHTVTLGGEKRIVHCFSLVLPFSRYMVVRYALDETLDTLIAMHDEAFRDIGAIPGVLTYDNMTTVGRHVGPGEIWINPVFGDWAKRCGFDIFLIEPGKPNQHASVERPFHYIENNCLRRRRFTFADFDDLDAHVRWWCANVANIRPHGATRERPVDRLIRERPFLKPLPANRPEPFRELARQVGTDFCVAVDTNRYSVPPRCAGQVATVRLFADRIEILVAGDLVAVHPRHDSRYGRLVLPEHEAEFKHWTPSRRLLEQAFLRLGDVARDYHQGLLAQRGKGAGYHLQRILKQADRHGGAVVVAAMQHAASYGNYSAEAVARVIAGRQMPRVRNSPASKLAQPPEQVRLWLEGLDVETGDLAAYDRMVDRAASPEGNPDGQG